MLGLMLALAHAPARSMVLAIDVTALLPMSAVELRTMIGETTAIWKPHGIVLTWITATADRESVPRGVVRVLGDGCGVETLCPPAITEPVGVTSAARRRLGAVVFAERTPATETTLMVSVNAVAKTMARVNWQNRAFTDLPEHTRGHLIGRALGRVLAHELGHYLLAWRVHDRDGLMRAEFRADELIELSRQEFLLTDTQLPLLRLRLARLAAEDHYARSAAIDR
jgi:hypothetical protein